MRPRIFSIVFCLAIAGVGVSSATAQPKLVIDDFKQSPYRKELRDQPTFLTEYQTGPTEHIVGGVRQTNFTVSQAKPHFGQSTLLQIRRNGPLVMSGGYKSFFGLLLGYGYDTNGGAQRLNLNLSGGGSECLGCDRFRINFDGCDSELSYGMQVHDDDGDIATLNGTESTAGRILPFHVDFPFSDFVQDSAHPVNWDHINFIFVLFQTGNPIGGHDFAVTRITAIPAPTPTPTPTP